MSSSGAVSLADIFFTFFPPIAASARSLAFFFSFASVTPVSMASRVFSAFSRFSFASSLLLVDDELLGLLGLLELLGLLGLLELLELLGLPELLELLGLPELLEDEVQMFPP